MLFAADVAGDGIDDTNDGTIYSDRSGALVLLHRDGDQAPFDNLVLYESLTSPAFNAGGLISFGAALDIEGGPEETTVGLFQELEPGFLVPFAVDTFTAPPDIELTGLAPAPFNDLGQSAFAASDGAGLWITGGDEGLEIVAQAGTPLVGMPDGTEVKHLAQPALANDGDVAFHASFSTPDNDGPDLDDGIWLGDASGLSAVAISGDQAAGLPGGIVYAGTSRTPSIASGGQVAFLSRVDGDGIDESNDRAIWAGTPGALSLVARLGDAAPGIDGAVFAGLAERIGLSDAGAVAFVGQVAGDGITTEDNSAIWAGTPGDLGVVVREGDDVPGAAGMTFGVLSSPAVTDSGFVAFTAQLRADAEEIIPNFGLFLAAPGGGITAVAMEGDPFSIGGEDKTISDLAFDSPGGGRSSLAEDGTVLFKVYFEDRSQALVMGAQGCYGDFNGDGDLNVLDFVAYQIAWQDMDPAADCDGNGAFNVLDFVCFQQAWQAGCE